LESSKEFWALVEYSEYLFYGLIVPEEVPSTPGKFVTRHSASCNFGHMDTDAISYLGHLPQDLIGNSILDYYHPEDMLLLKSIYEGGTQSILSI
jgi:period circadian protein